MHEACDSVFNVSEDPTMKRILIIAVLFLASTAIAISQNSIHGRITDEEGSPLQFANIVVTHSITNGTATPLKSQIGGISDLEGYYILPSVPNGTFDVQVIYIGYQLQTFRVDLGGAIRDVQQDISMISQSQELEEVVVSAQAKGQLAAINQQLSSTALTNVVASDRIRQNPDANAAEAVGRLPGITVSRERPVTL